MPFSAGVFINMHSTSRCSPLKTLHFPFFQRNLSENQDFLEYPDQIIPRFPNLDENPKNPFSPHMEAIMVGFP